MDFSLSIFLIILLYFLYTSLALICPHLEMEVIIWQFKNYFSNNLFKYFDFHFLTISPIKDKTKPEEFFIVFSNI